MNEHKSYRSVWTFLTLLFFAVFLFDYLLVNQFVSVRNASAVSKNYEIILNGFIAFLSKKNFVSFFSVKDLNRAFLLFSAAMMIRYYVVGKRDKSKNLFRRFLMVSFLAAVWFMVDFDYSFARVYYPFAESLLFRKGSIITFYVNEGNWVSSFSLPLAFIIYFSTMMAALRNYSNVDDVKDDKDPLARLPKRLENKVKPIIFNKKKIFFDEDLDLSATFNTKKGKLHISYLNQGTCILGNNGTGKSFYVLEKLICQWMKKGFPSYIYDFKGNPTTLGLTAYVITHILRGRGQRLPDLRIFNPSDMLRSHRLNPISPRYIDTSNQIDSSNLAKSIFTNLSQESAKKMDFWAQNAVTIIGTTIWTLAKHKPEYCTFGHLIALILSGIKNLVKVLLYLDREENNVVRMSMGPVITAYENKAEGQIAGLEATVQLAFSALNDPTIFHLASVDETSLEINNPFNLATVVACCNPEKKEALQALLGAISSTIKTKINQSSRVPCAYFVDEFKTIVIPNFAELINTGRSNGMVGVIAFQDFNQIVETYGKDAAKVIYNSLGNQVILRITDYDTIRELSERFGEVEKAKFSQTINKGGDATGSTGKSTQKEKVLKPSDISSLDIGEAVGVVASARDPRYRTQFALETMDKTLNMNKKERYWYEERLKVGDVPVFYKSEKINKEVAKIAKKDKLDRLEIESLTNEKLEKTMGDMAKTNYKMIITQTDNLILKATIYEER